MAEENVLPADAAEAAAAPVTAAPGAEGEEPEDDRERGRRDSAEKLVFIILGAVVAIGGGVGYYMWSQSQAEAKRKQAELEATPEYQLKKQMEFRKENKPQSQNQELGEIA